ncbi:MAG: rod-binding protein [Desulfohalobiaceae bacterium]|nr:rod-binding protein [Desulfohalobiaceae bacterium]MCF8086266.1 rod-binding protein [Desulfohalobiaceae bacterium]
MTLAFDPQMQIPRSAFQEAGKGNQPENRAMKEVCRNFEAFFVQSMFKEMRDTVPQDGLIDKSFGSDIYREMLDKQVALQSAKRNDFGLARAMYRQYGPSQTEAESQSQERDPEGPSRK